jgi:hypothetical protein
MSAGENEQEKANRFFEHWLRVLQEEMREKEQTIIEIMARLDLRDEKIAQRIESKEYQSLLKKTFREWSGTESEAKRAYIRNILSNAALKTYSELHFQVIAAVYNSHGISSNLA